MIPLGPCYLPTQQPSMAPQYLSVVSQGLQCQHNPWTPPLTPDPGEEAAPVSVNAVGSTAQELGPNLSSAMSKLHGLG